MIPTSEREISQIVQEAIGPLRIQGGGTRPIGVSQGTPLVTTGLSGIELYEPGALTVVVKSGTPLADLEAALSAENQRLPFEPMDHRSLLGTKGESTIGGVIAANVSGPRRIQVGAARDFMLGVRFVDGAGNIIKNGGRVMKNVTGYDLVKLMSGSFGTLGVMTEVALKVLPKSDVVGTVMIKGLSEHIATKALSAALGSPFDVSGAAHLPANGGDAAQTLVRIEGFEASVAYRMQQVADVLAKFGEVEQITDAKTIETLWTSVRDVKPFQNIEGDVWRVSVKPSQAADLVAQVKPKDAVLDWGGGLVWLLVEEGVDVRPVSDPFHGHATRIRGGNATPAFQPEPKVLADISAGLRAKFDPRGLLNPGLMG